MTMDRYEEALKQAKEFVGKEECINLEYIFPELKESEDEKIRKWLIAQLEIKSGSNDIDRENMILKAITWLEKQGNTNIFDVPKISIKNAVEVTSRMQYIDDDIKPIAEFIIDYANWDLHKDEWNQPTLTVPLFRVLDALIQKGKPYCACNQNIEKQCEQKKQVYFPKFTFDDILALQCCMETVKKVQEDKDLYEKLNDIHGRVYDAYYLEKQGKPVEINPSEFDSQLNKLLKQFETLPKEELINSLNFYLNVVQNNGTYKEKKQCEKPQGKSAVDAINEEKVDNQNCVKPSIKGEPKFKVGDYVVDNCGYTWRIEGIINQFYILEGIDGGESRPTIECVNKTFHLWTISDAKNGDILHSTGFHNDCIFIFNGLDNWKFDELSGDRAVATGYCCLSVSADNMEFGMQGPDCVEVSTVKPATKIQRDLLFRKIKEAGYKWDAEKIEHKPTWSDEDESNFQGIIDELKANKHHAPDYDLPTYDRFLSWFKSLKERYFGN